MVALTSTPMIKITVFYFFVYMFPCTSPKAIRLCPISRTRTGYIFHYYLFIDRIVKQRVQWAVLTAAVVIDNVYFGHFANFNLHRDITSSTGNSKSGVFGTAWVHAVVRRRMPLKPQGNGTTLIRKFNTEILMEFLRGNNNIILNYYMQWYRRIWSNRVCNETVRIMSAKL